jgi:hypothetical protein
MHRQKEIPKPLGMQRCHRVEKKALLLVVYQNQWRPSYKLRKLLDQKSISKESFRLE